MDAAYEFALNGELMDFALYRIGKGHLIPAHLFIDILTEKCQLINRYLHSTRDCLMIVANLSGDGASIKFHAIHYEELALLCDSIILTNKPDLDDQLIYLWMEVRDLLWYFHIGDHTEELDSIHSFYRHLAYDQFVQADFNI